jgi:tRNA-dihydrouridine synthase
MLKETGCDGVMIGRAAIGNPWIFSQSLALLNGKVIAEPDYATRLAVILRYIDHTVDHFGELRAVRMMRSRLTWFVKGFPQARGFRNRIVRIDSEQVMKAVVTEYFETLMPTETSPLSA